MTLNVESEGVTALESKEAASSLPDWEHDRQNPNNWSLAKKIYNSAVPAFLCFAMQVPITFGLSIYTPQHGEIQEAFHVSSTVSLLPYALYVYGLGFGPMIAAPLSESYGRRLIYIVATPMSLLFTLGVGFSKNMGGILVCRFLAGTFGSPPLAVGAGTLTDLWGGRRIARAMTLLFATSLLGPSLGPVVGGYIAEYTGWRWSQWTILFLGAAAWFFSFGAQETYGKVLLRTRAKRHGLPVPPRVPLKQLLTVTCTRPIYMLLTDPIVAFFSLYTSFVFSMLFSFLAAFPPVFQSTYGFSPGEGGLVFLGITTGCTVGAGVAILIDQLIYQKRLESLGSAIAPEQRLWASLLGSVMMPVSLFWFAWTAQISVHWMVPIVAASFFGCAGILIFVSCILYMTDVYGAAYGASAMAANGLLRYGMGGSFPLFIPFMYDRLHTDWATSLLAFLSTAFIPLPWLLFWLGPRIRQLSSFSKQ
ncbi:MFS general substrate transporter [Aspergillus avenaceus]|uniref:MFS general substrate transporter n=1 Tax=Aspergillus avenaceus TaxID=36643 RepID=A0A5N6THE1_ASPAV|nr:MFS general substrate transporter [Aspergillus avenaceus]